jgi:hypothetical protein
MLEFLKSPPQNIVKVISQLELEREQRLKQALKFEEMELQLVQKLKQTQQKHSNTYKEFQSIY